MYESGRAVAGTAALPIIQRRWAQSDEQEDMVCVVQGRKKNTDNAGTAVGGIAAAAALTIQKGKVAKPVVDFYRFQQKERRRS